MKIKLFRKRHDFLPKNSNFKFESKNSQKKLKFGQKFRISKFWSKFSVKNSTPISTEHFADNIPKFGMKNSVSKFVSQIAVNQLKIGQKLGQKI